ncbi:MULTISPECIES: YrpD family protein [unclassified Paenibacillus]|uniref:YrpD family protein n=1 Tax=unclassified Paenibacillus TaxID=185978 RepID=UPI002404B93A|nr:MULTISPECIES: YrpD family protein [unclassified Paenibacillus]MDF9847216.1 hypothetical protein [Paenibacillus sp. PastM-2]MDF9840633.1 hypothetical protein [Paenibacillus sp. PastF-2]MDF9853787.1 hypothetical protein [Paenibacillus sp. PastF-1]MDH6478727.1 hypothetical protein [Paenibacillus sp. PastH-2]MDH6506459.1 hypothetical protein [Paenibacillus sp. PastM-3]
MTGLRYKKIYFLLSLSLVLLVPVSPQVKAEANPTNESQTDFQNFDVINQAKTSQSNIQDFINQARQVSLEYAPSKSSKLNKLVSDPQVFNYTYVDGDVGYFYELSSLDDQEFVATYPAGDVNTKQDVASPEDIISNQNVFNSKTAVFNAAAAVDPIGDGVGGKATVSKNGSVETFVIHTPATTTGPTARTYIYSGFSGTGVGKTSTTLRTIETDMGLVFSNAYGVNKWQPTINYYWGNAVDGHDSPGDRISPYNEVWYMNGYIPNNDINVTIYRNLNNNTRLSTAGYAYYQKHDGTGGNSYLTAVTEIANTKVSSTTSWKYLATIADTVIKKDGVNIPQGDAAGSVVVTFKNIILDNVAVAPVLAIQDFASVGISGNNVTISVSK